MSTTDQTTIDVRKRAAFVGGLRDLADWYDKHPDFDLPYELENANAAHPFTVGVFKDHMGGPDTTAVRFADAVRQLGGARSKDPSDGYMRVTREFGPGVALEVWVMRDEVCEAVVVGTETVVVNEVVRPAVTKSVETQRDIVEWRCAPVLAGTIGVADARASLNGVA